MPAHSLRRGLPCFVLGVVAFGIRLVMLAVVVTVLLITVAFIFMARLAIRTIPTMCRDVFR